MMNYQSGRMGMAEGIALAFVVTFPPVFLSVPSASIEAAGSVAWLVAPIGGLIGIVLMYIYIYLLGQYPGDLFTLSNKLLGKPLTYLIALFYFFTLFGMATLWTREFAENTLLTALPFAAFDNVVTWYGLSAAFLVYAGIEAICRATYVIIPFGITGLLLVLAGLYSEYHPLYLFPWQGKGLSTLISPVLRQVGLSGPLVLLAILAPSFQNVQTVRSAVIWGYGGNVLLRSLAVTVFLMVFGSAVAMEKTLPFYEMARLIYLNRYIQRLEALFILLWVIIGILAIAICLYGSLYIIARLFKMPTIRPLLPAMSLIMIQVAMLPPDTSTVLSIESILLINIFAPGVAAIPMLLLAASLLKGGKKSCMRA